MFTMRTSKPKNNKYYIVTEDGGYNYAIKGKPTDQYANVLSNCVGYANGRFGEIMAQITGEQGIKYQLSCNAENFIERAIRYGLEVTDEPTLGGILVWKKGATLSGNDGAGHVAIVEKIIDSNTIYTSESNYGGTAFLNVTRKNTNGRWGLGSAYTYRGCIKNPAVKDEPDPKKSIDEIAREVLAGDWGNGAIRKARLKAAGYDPTEVQNRVNEILYGDPKDKIKVGDEVVVTDPINYNTGKKFKLYYKTYDVFEVSGDRAVIGKKGVVTAAINLKYLRKV